MRYRWGILWVILLSCIQLNAQKVTINGHIVDALDSSALPYTHVVDELGRPQAIANNKGYFTMEATPGDTLVCTFTGYRAQPWVVPHGNDKPLSITITMMRDSVYLDEVRVNALPPPHLFKTAFKNTRGDPRTAPVQFPGLATYDGPVREPSPNVFNPASFIYNKLNRKAFQNRRMEKARRKLGTSGTNPMQKF